MSSAWQNVGMARPQKKIKKISGIALRLIFHRFSPRNCCLNVVLYPDKGYYPENSHVAFCPNK